MINFNHPIIAFKKRERKFIEFGHYIFKKYLEEGSKIKPTKEDLKN